MPYGQPDPPPMAMDATGNSGMGQGDPSGEMQANTIHIAASDLPEGVQAQAGTKVLFCITGPPDAEGDVPGYFEMSDHDESAEGEEGEGTSWEEDFRKEMSPRSGGGEDQQEPM